MSATQGALLSYHDTSGDSIVQSVFNIAGSGAATTYSWVQNYRWTLSGVSDPARLHDLCDMAVDVTGKMLFMTYGPNFGKTDITALLTPTGAGGTLAVTENTSPSDWPLGDCFQMVNA
jgi:hypothetical protein